MSIQLPYHRSSAVDQGCIKLPFKWGRGEGKREEGKGRKGGWKEKGKRKEGKGGKNRKKREGKREEKEKRIGMEGEWKMEE